MCCVVLRCAVFCRVAQRCAVLGHAVLCCGVLCCAVLYCVALRVRRVSLCCVALRRALRCCDVLRGAMAWCAVSWRVVMCCDVLCYSCSCRVMSGALSHQSERPLWRLLLLWLVLIQVGGREVPPLLLNFVPHIWLLDFREWISADGSCQRRFSIRAV